MNKAFTIVTALAVVVTFADCIDAQRRGRRGNMTPEQRAERQAQQAAQQQKELDAAAAIADLDSVWIEELTWHEVRDAIAAGKTTALIGTGGVEPNGPYLATGKHNYVLQGALEGVARELGNALVAPIVKFVPEGNYDPPSGHMASAGTISLKEETFQALLTDICMSLKAHGFENIIMFGDSGGNQGGMGAVAAALNEKWGTKSAHFIPEFYRYGEVATFMGDELGVVQPSRDGFHDDYVITTIMMVTDPTSVRYQQRVAAGASYATINGLSIEPLDASVEMGKKLLQFRVEQTVKAINASISSDG